MTLREFINTQWPETNNVKTAYYLIHKHLNAKPGPSLMALLALLLFASGTVRWVYTGSAERNDKEI
jgi:hypothetical protein